MVWDITLTGRLMYIHVHVQVHVELWGQSFIAGVKLFVPYFTNIQKLLQNVHVCNELHHTDVKKQNREPGRGKIIPLAYCTVHKCTSQFRGTQFELIDSLRAGSYFMDM